MAILQGNTYLLPVQVKDCDGAVIHVDQVEKGEFTFGTLVKFYGDNGDVSWDEELQSFIVPLTEEETFAFKGVVVYQGRLLLKNGSVSGSVPTNEYIYESIGKTILSESGEVGEQSGKILTMKLLDRVVNTGITEEVDPTVPSHVKEITEQDISEWNKVKTLGNVLKYKGSVQTYGDLPTENNVVGDTWNVIEPYGDYGGGTNFAWSDKGEWDALGSAINVDDLLLNAQKQIILGADGVLEGDVYNFTVKNPETFLPYKTNNTKFLMDLHLPIVGDLDKSKKYVITFGDTVYYVYSILKGQEHMTIGDLHQVDKYHNQTGYRFITEMTFFENAEITGFAIIPTISMSDVLSLTSDEMDNYIAEGGLTQGQLVICKEVITNGYTEGGLYRFDITYPDTYTWTELSSGGGLKIINVNDTITTGDLKEVVNLTDEQYSELTEKGSIVVDGQTITFDDNTLYVTPDISKPNILTFSGTSVLTSAETFRSHVHIMVEFETDSIHAGFDCVLHPYDEAVCFVTYNVLVNGTPNFATAYLNENGNVVINVPSGLTFTNVHGKYVVYGG